MRNEEWFEEKRAELYEKASGEVWLLMKKLPHNNRVVTVGVVSDGDEQAQPSAGEYVRRALFEAVSSAT